MAKHLLYANAWSGLEFYYLAGDQGGNFANMTFNNNLIDFRPLLTAGINSQYAYGINVAPKGKVTGMTATGNQILASPIAGLRIGNPAERSNKSQSITFQRNTIVDTGWDTTVDPAANVRAAVILDTATLIGVYVDNNTIHDTGAPGAPKADFSVLAVPGGRSSNVSLRYDSITPHGVLQFHVTPLVDNTGTIP